MKILLISFLFIGLITAQSGSSTFTLSFQYAARNRGSLDSQYGNVIWNNNIVISIVATDLNVHTASVVVTAITGQNVLQIEGAGASDGHGLGVTNFALIQQGDITNTNVLVNGDFSQPNLGFDAIFLNKIPGWKTGPGQKLEIGTRRIYNGAWGSQNNQLIELDSNVNYEVTQILTFDNNFQVIKNSLPPACTPSSLFKSPPTYTLTFDWAATTVGTTNLLTSQANVLWNNAVIASIAPYGITVFHASYQVTINPCGSNSLQFDGTWHGDGFGLLVSNIQISSTSGSPIALSGVWNVANPKFVACSTLNSQWTGGQCFSLDSGTNQRYSLLVTIPYTPQKSLDIVGLQTKNAFECLAQQGYTYAIVRADSNTVGVRDATAIQTLSNAQAGGLSTDIYMLLCFFADPVTQVTSVIQGINDNLYNVVWFKLVANKSPQCGLSNNQTKNCLFVSRALQGINQIGRRAGIFTTRNIWNTKFGSACSFGQLGQTYLWYADYQTNGIVNPTQSFSDFTGFQGFGGWTQPDLKTIYGSVNVTLCGNPLWRAFVNINWHL